MLEIKALSAGYGANPILKQIDLQVLPGQVTVLLGPNGCGKTTLLKTLCGILPASEGSVKLDGEELLKLQPNLLARKVAYLAQGRQVPEITAERLVLHGRFPYLDYPRRYRPEDHAAARAAMEQMGISHLARTQLDQMSGGQRQKCYIAMALAQDTQVLLLDEPTTYLDIGHQLQLLRQAKALARQGKTVLMVIHDLSHALHTADRLVLMENGTVAAEGTPEALYESGAVERVFGVAIGRVRTEKGWRYYCEEE